MTKRSYIRFVSFVGFLLVVIVATAIISTNLLRSTKQELEVSYQQSLNELYECLNQVDADITKSLYSADQGEIYDLSRDLYAQCTTAKNALSRLPVSQMELNNAYKFLSQCSDYAQYIGAEIDKGNTISQEQHKNLLELLGYCEQFLEQAQGMVDNVNNGALITENEVKSVRQVKTNSLSTSFDNSVKAFEDFPTLLYDGPFSDQVLNRNSLLVSKGKVCTKDQCKAIAANAIGAKKASLVFEADDQSKIPCYTFKCGRYTVLVTKQGGYIKEILYSGVVNKTNLSRSNASNLAKDYLEKLGYKNMECNYYTTQDNTCTVNCVYVKDNVWCYGDLVKATISLEDGRLLGVDAKTYLTNHRDRKIAKAKIDTKTAKSKVSSYLNIKGVKKCIIPKESGKEVLCYEIKCNSKDTGEDALVYINCENAKEEDIMLLLKTDNGTLVK